VTDGTGKKKKPEKGSGRVSTQLRRHFLTGILVVTPAAVAGWVLYNLLAWIDGLLWDYVRFGWVRPGGIPGVGLITVVLLILLVGVLVNNYVGRRFYGAWDRLLGRIPLFNKIYLAVKQIGESLLSRDATVFKAVGLIEYPRKGIFCLVFVTEVPGPEVTEAAGENLRSVFLPTTPNPTSGFLLMLPDKDIKRLPMSVEEGLKMVISGGAYVPGRGISWGPDVTPVRLRGRPSWWRRLVGAKSPGEVAVEPEQIQNQKATGPDDQA
jgi:uncharacterized membrane protein